MFLTWQLPILQIWHWVWSLNWAKDDGQGEMGGTPWEPSKGLDSSPSVTQWSMGPRLSHFMSTSVSLGTEGGHCEQMFCFAFYEALYLNGIMPSFLSQIHQHIFPLAFSLFPLAFCFILLLRWNGCLTEASGQAINWNLLPSLFCWAVTTYCSWGTAERILLVVLLVSKVRHCTTFYFHCISLLALTILNLTGYTGSLKIKDFLKKPPFNQCQSKFII